MARSLEPVFFPIVPPNAGMNTSVAPTAIATGESPDCFNVRFSKRRLLVRSGFKLKYKGCRETPLWVDVVYSAGLTKLVVFGQDGIYYESGDAFVLCPLYDGIGGEDSYPYLSMDPASTNISVDVGEGKYDFVTAFSGAVYPAADKYGDIMAMCNGTSDGIIIIAYTGEADPVEAEICTAAGAPTLGRVVVIFDNRLVVLGTEDSNSEARWTEQGRFDHWDPGTYPSAGSYLLGDSPDWIQAARRLGEYLIVYKERSMYIGHRSFIADPAIIFTPAPGQGIGLAGPMTVGDLGEEHIFLGWDDVYTFSLKTMEPVGTRIKQELFYGPNGILPQYLSNCTGVVAEEFDEYWLFVPTGKWPGGADDAAISNLIVNPILIDDAADDEPDDWTVDTKVSGTAAISTGGLFGNSLFELADPEDEGVNFLQTYDFTALQGTGIELTMRIWLIPVAGHAVDGCKFKVDLVETDGADGDGTTHTFNFTYAATVYDIETHEDMSFVSEDADFEKLRVVITLDNDTEIHFDAVHLLNITNVDSSYLTTNGTAKVLGYLDGSLEVQEIPFIVDSIGKWLPDTVWVFNYEENAWSAWRMPMTGFGYDSLANIISIAELTGLVSEQGWRFGERRSDKLAPTNLIGECDGNVYEVSELSARDWGGVLNTSFLAYWQSKDINLNVPGIDKTFSRVILYHETSHSPMTVTVGISLDSSLTWTEIDVTIRVGRTSTFADFFVTGPQARFQVKCVPPGFVINGFAVKILPRGEANDYDL